MTLADVQVTKRARSQYALPGIPSSVEHLKQTDPAAYREWLLGHLSSLPAHEDDETSSTGWWCAHPTLMAELLSYLATEPRNSCSEHKTWTSFRDRVAHQLLVCRQCVLKYHRAVAEWRVGAERSAMTRLARWDVSRIHPWLSRGLSNARDDAEQNVWRARCTHAFLESLLSVRICINRGISETLGNLLKKISPVDNAADLNDFFQRYGAFPPGLLVLCFHKVAAVHVWAQRLYKQAIKAYEADVNATSYVLRKAVERIQLRESDAETSNRCIVASFQVAWGGLGLILKHLDPARTRRFAEDFLREVPGRKSRRGSLIELMARGLVHADDEVASSAADALLAIVKAVPSKSLFVTEVMSPDGVLESVIHSYRNTRRLLSTKLKLLHLVAPMLACGKACHIALPDLFDKGFEFICTWSLLEVPGSNPVGPRSGSRVLDAFHKERAALMRTGADFLGSYYSLASPHVNLKCSDSISKFILAVLKESGDAKWAWSLLRIACFWDALNVVRHIVRREDQRATVEALLMNRSLDGATNSEEGNLMRRAVEMEPEGGWSMRWLRLLWLRLGTGAHCRQAGVVQSQEVELLLDLHRLISLIDASVCEHTEYGDVRSSVAMGQNELGHGCSSAPSRSEQRDVKGCLNTIQGTVRNRLSLALGCGERQSWWGLLPFHATHLMNSPDKEVRSSSFKALILSRGLENACVHGDLKETNLLLNDMRIDPSSASMLASGCQSFMKVMMALRSCMPVQTISSFMLWLNRLWDCDYQGTLGGDDVSWGLAAVVVFVQNWKAFEKRTGFKDSCGQFFHRLREMWGDIVSLRIQGDVVDVNFQDLYESRLIEICNGLFDMHELKDMGLRGSWVHTMCSVASFWKNFQSLRERAVLIIELQESSRTLYSYAHCARIAKCAELDEVQVVLNRWSKAKENMKETKITNYFSKNSGSSTESPIVFVEKREPSRDPLHPPVCRKSERSWPSSTSTPSGGDRTRPVSFVVNRRIMTDNPGITRGIYGRRSLRQATRAAVRNSRPASALEGIKREHRTSRRETTRQILRANVSRKAVAAPLEGGKTEFELLVEQRRANQEKRRAELSSKERGPSSFKTTGKGMQRVAVGGHGRAWKRHADSNDDDAASPEVFVVDENSFALPAERRRLEPRLIEQVYRSLVSNSEVDLEGGVGWRQGLPNRFEDVEAYVQVWQPIIVAEFLASVRAVLKEERKYAEAEILTKGNYTSCRAVFEVSAPVESVGYVQNISLRYLAENRNTLDSTRGHEPSLDFDVSRAQPYDVMLLDISPSRSVHNDVPSRECQSTLGLVSKVQKQKGEFTMKLHVALRPTDGVPGTGRRVRVSRLTGTTTFRRQLEALWALPKAPDGILWAVLEPRDGLKVNSDVCSELAPVLMNSLAPYMSFIRELQSRRILNESQAMCIENVVQACAPTLPGSRQISRDRGVIGKHGSVSFIQGPPGTGKTSTILGLLSAILFSDDCHQRWRPAKVQLEDGLLSTKVAPVRVLVCAPSNAAVDEIMSRAMNDGLHTPSFGRASPRMLRIGGGSTAEEVGNLEIRKLMERTSETSSDRGKPSTSAQRFNKLIAELATVNSQISVMDSKRRQAGDSLHRAESGKDGFDAESRTMAKAYRQLTEELSGLHRRKKEIGEALDSARSSREGEDRDRRRESTSAMCKLLNSTSVVFATLSSAGHDVLKNLGVRFDVIIIDEAGQCGEPEAMIPVSGGYATQRACTGPAHVVLVGDPKQLPATVISTNKNVQRALGRSWFERVSASRPDVVHMLNTQYRMHPDIALFPSKHFYDSRLLNGSNVMSEDMEKPFHLDPQGRFGPLTFLDTSAVDSREVKRPSGSLYNPHEGSVVVAAITALVRNYGKDAINDNVVVLSPYRGQVSYLRNSIAENSFTRDCAVEVSTVDGIQGREKSIVFLSTVRSGDSGGIGFVDDERRMNVAITRARHSLIIVGNGAALESHSQLWRAHLSHCRSHSRLLSVPGDLFRIFPEGRRNAGVAPSSHLPPHNRRRISAADRGTSKSVEKRVNETEVARGVSLRSARVEVPNVPRDTTDTTEEGETVRNGVPNAEASNGDVGAVPESHKESPLGVQNEPSDRPARVARVEGDSPLSLTGVRRGSTAQSHDRRFPSSSASQRRLSAGGERHRKPDRALAEKECSSLLTSHRRDDALRAIKPKVPDVRVHKDLELQQSSRVSTPEWHLPRHLQLSQRLTAVQRDNRQKLGKKPLSPTTMEHCRLQPLSASQTPRSLRKSPHYKQSTHVSENQRKTESGCRSGGAFDRLSPILSHSDSSSSSQQLANKLRSTKPGGVGYLSSSSGVRVPRHTQQESLVHGPISEPLMAASDLRDQNFGNAASEEKMKARLSETELPSSLDTGSRRPSILDRLEMPSGRFSRGSKTPLKNDPKAHERRLLALASSRKRELPAANSSTHLKRRKVTPGTDKADRLKPVKPGAPAFSLAQSQRDMKKTREMVRRATGRPY